VVFLVPESRSATLPVETPAKAGKGDEPEQKSRQVLKGKLGLDAYEPTPLPIRPSQRNDRDFPRSLDRCRRQLHSTTRNHFREVSARHRNSENFRSTWMHPRIACIGEPPSTDGFAARVAKNRWVDAEMFSSRQEALDWPGIRLEAKGLLKTAEAGPPPDLSLSD